MSRSRNNREHLQEITKIAKEAIDKIPENKLEKACADLTICATWMIKNLNNKGTLSTPKSCNGCTFFTGHKDDVCSVIIRKASSHKDQALIKIECAKYIIDKLKGATNDEKTSL